jgi:nitrogen fixation protein FixH
MTIRFHLGVAVVVFYVVFALSTVGFVLFAMSQDVDLVSSDYYARGLQHDRHMQAVANAGALGATLRIEVDREAEQVRVQFPPVMAPRLAGSATLYRPASAREDRAVPIIPSATGAIAMSTSGLTAGHWRLQLQWTADGRDFYVERELMLR